MASGKGVDGKRENTEESINTEPFSASRSSSFRHLQTVFPLPCFARFSLLVLARPATDYSTHTHYYSFSIHLPRGLFLYIFCTHSA